MLNQTGQSATTNRINFACLDLPTRCLRLCGDSSEADCFCSTFSITLVEAADAVNYIQTFISQRCQVDLPMTKTFCLILLLSNVAHFWVWLTCPCFVTSFHEKRDTLDLLAEVGSQRLCLVCDSFMAAQLATCSTSMVSARYNT